MAKRTTTQAIALLIIGMMGVMSVSSMLQFAFAEEGTPAPSEFLQVKENFVQPLSWLFIQ